MVASGNAGKFHRSGSSPLVRPSVLHTHTHTGVHTVTHVCIHTHMYIHTRTRTHACMCKNVWRIQMHVRKSGHLLFLFKGLFEWHPKPQSTKAVLTHTHAFTHTHTHAFTHTHTHTRIYTHTNRKPQPQLTTAKTDPAVVRPLNIGVFTHSQCYAFSTV